MRKIFRTSRVLVSRAFLLEEGTSAFMRSASDEASAILDMVPLIFNSADVDAMAADAMVAEPAADRACETCLDLPPPRVGRVGTASCCPSLLAECGTKPCEAVALGNHDPEKVFPRVACTYLLRTSSSLRWVLWVFGTEVAAEESPSVPTTESSWGFTPSLRNRGKACSNSLQGKRKERGMSRPMRAGQRCCWDTSVTVYHCCITMCEAIRSKATRASSVRCPPPACCGLNVAQIFMPLFLRQSRNFSSRSSSPVRHSELKGLPGCLASLPVAWKRSPMAKAGLCRMAMSSKFEGARISKRKSVAQDSPHATTLNLLTLSCSMVLTTICQSCSLHSRTGHNRRCPVVLLPMPGKSMRITEKPCL
mmetsp:Transcript_87098/g.186751  ORF Transcript_87098/g.186751 Transcript_87098/m.186751 type:complete len:364 (+) Transcript_87098:282-1373(+)